ncbi:5653_t:CDS:2, partial [Funneliformis caledonium]
CISLIELVNEELILASGSKSELLLDLGLIDDDSLADVESSADNLTNQTAGNNTDNAQIQLSRESSSKISRKQGKVQGLLQELSIPREPEEENDSEEGGESISQNLARLYKKASLAEKRVMKANQDEILC